MAGAGFRVFVDGDVLTAAQMNTYVMEQTIMVFATETTRDAAITSPTDGMFAYTTTTPADTLAYYNGSSWVAVDLAGDITGITTAANSSLAGGATSGAPSLSADVNNTTSATATSSDYVLIEDVDDSNATKKALISDITALVPQGDLTGLTAGNLVDITSATGPVPTIDVDLSEASTSTSDADGDFFLVTDAASAQYKLTKANIALSGFNNDGGFAAGTVTAVSGTSPMASTGGTTPAISVDTQDAQFILSTQVFVG
ncbi:MAG: hypothetical protein CL489_03020 [Acidobacteria bacterium]|nr:hypothetical protein [Acidobacteriota bacterium]